MSGTPACRARSSFNDLQQASQGKGCWRFQKEHLKKKHWPEALHAANTILGPQGMTSAIVFDASDAIMQELLLPWAQMCEAFRLLCTAKMTDNTIIHKGLSGRHCLGDWLHGGCWKLLLCADRELFCLGSLYRYMSWLLCNANHCV